VPWHRVEVDLTRFSRCAKRVTLVFANRSAALAIERDWRRDR
jgi:hypothetical protein